MLCCAAALQYVLGSTREQVAAFISTLPIRKVPGVGKVSALFLWVGLCMCVGVGGAPGPGLRVGDDCGCLWG